MAAPPLPQAQDLVTGFTRWVSEQPEAPALSFRGRLVTYAELYERVTRIEGLLVSRGLQPGSSFGMALARGPDMVAAMLAALLRGFAYVPVDPTHPPARGRAAIAQTRPELVLADDAGRAAVGPIDALLVDPRDAAPSPAPPRSAPSPRQAAYHMLTSGSTGRPKVSTILRGGLEALLPATAERFGVSESDVFFAMGSVAFDLSVLELLLPLWVGAQIHLVDDETRAHPGRLREAMDACAPTVVNTTPSGFRLLLDAGWRGAPRAKLLVGGEPLTAELARELLPRGRELWNKYGPTECTVIVAARRVDCAERAAELGDPLAGHRLLVLDERGRPAEEGELTIVGPGVSAGYVGEPERTAQAFRRLAGHGPRAFRTGDRVRRRGDRLVPRGRKGDEVKVNGLRVALPDVEAAILEHPRVRHAAVTLLPDGSLRAFYTPARAGDRVSLDELRPQLEGHLMRAAWPRELTRIPAMPMTSTGKLDRRALRSGYAERLTSTTARPRGAAPEGDLEVVVERAVRKALRLDRPIERTESLLDLGATSFVALQALLSIERTLGRHLPAGPFIAAPNIEAQARVIVASGGERPPREAVQLTSIGGPPLFCLCGVHLYAELAAAVTTGPVFGLTVPSERALHAREGPLPTVNALAAESLARIREVQKRGPYRLAGASFAGLVALEVARSLQRDGQRVEGVVALDTRLPWAWPRARAKSVVSALRRLAGPGSGWSARADLARDAYLRTRPAADPIDVLVVRADLPGDEGPRPLLTDLGWSRLVSRPPVVRSVEAGHLEILRGEPARRTARFLDDFFEARSASSSWSG